jgi:CRP-like cAMP-binding protein
MVFGSSHVRRIKRAHHGPVRIPEAGTARSKNERRQEKMGEVMMEAEAISVRMGSVAAHPLSELLACPADAGDLLNGSGQCIDIAEGDAVFRQGDVSKGLYVVMSGLFVRKAERLKTRLTLGPARTGDLVELAAALGDGRHTYTLSAQSAGSVLMLPIEALNRAFGKYPPLRMKLLEELAREVSRAYLSCCMTRPVHTRRRADAAELP